MILACFFYTKQDRRIFETYRADLPHAARAVLAVLRLVERHARHSTIALMSHRSLVSPLVPPHTYAEFYFRRSARSCARSRASSFPRDFIPCVYVCVRARDKSFVASRYATSARFPTHSPLPLLTNNRSSSVVSLVKIRCHVFFRTRAQPCQLSESAGVLPYRASPPFQHRLINKSTTVQREKQRATTSPSAKYASSTRGSRLGHVFYFLFPLFDATRDDAQITNKT